MFFNHFILRAKTVLPSFLLPYAVLLLCSLIPDTIQAGAGVCTGQTRPADILHSPWTLGAPAVLDLTVVHPLNATHFIGASTTANSASLASAAERKHAASDDKCQELGLSCADGGHRVGRVGWGGYHPPHLRAPCVGKRGGVHQIHAGVRQRLSVILIRENGRALLSSLCPGLGRAETATGATQHRDRNTVTHTKRGRGRCRAISRTQTQITVPHLTSSAVYFQ